MVFVEPDDLGPAQDFGQAVQQGGIGAVEAVDRLVGVAHHEEVGIVGEQRGEQAELGRVDVLHLVDEEVTAPPPYGVGEFAVAGQGVGTGDDEVVEVQQAPLRPLLLVAGVDLRHLVVVDAAAPAMPTCLALVLVRRNQPGLRPTDLTVEGSGAPGSPVVMSARSRRRSGMSWGAGRPRSSRCSRRRPRAVRWKVPARTPDTPRDQRRVRSSSAALRLKVVTRVRSASMEPSRTRRATRRVRTRVLPAPAPATTQSNGWSDSIASRWARVSRLAPGRASHESAVLLFALSLLPCRRRGRDHLSRASRGCA